MDDRGQVRRVRLWRPSEGWCPTLGLCALLGLPSVGLGGMLDTPLPTFSDGKAAQVVGLLPRVIKHDNLETVVICTNLDTVAANIGLEVFDKDGVLANSIAAGNGEILNVAVGATRTIGTAATAVLTEDHQILLLPGLRSGSGRIVASERNVFCVGMLVDEVHEILSPAICPTCPPPGLASAPVWACGNSMLDPLEQCDDGNPQSGDGCEADCTHGICGDVNDDGVVDVGDISFFRTHLADPNRPPLSVVGQSKCSVRGGPADCDVLDLVVLRRALRIPSLPPLVAPICEAVLG